MQTPKKFNTKLTKFKMTDEELQAHLKIKAQGAGMTKNKKKYQRHNKHRNATISY